MPSQSRPAAPRLGSFLVPLVVSALVTSGCMAAQYAVDHTVGARLGACGPSQDSVRTLRGDPYRTFVGDEEDMDTGEQTFEHEWGYRLRDEAGAVREDSVEVVRFRWGAGVRGCEVDDRTAKRGGRMGTPWEEADGSE